MNRREYEVHRQFRRDTVIALRNTSMVFLAVGVAILGCTLIGLLWGMVPTFGWGLFLFGGLALIVHGVLTFCAWANDFE